MVATLATPPALLGLVGCRRRGERLPVLSSKKPEDLRDRDSGRVLKPAQWETLEAACDRLLPRPGKPSAGEARVVNYIDSQLSLPHFLGFQQLFFAGVLTLDRLAGRVGRSRFVELDDKQKDAVLGQIERGVPIGRRRSSRRFFRVLLTLTLEGTLCDPIYGGNHEASGWRAIGHEPRPPRPRRPYRSDGREKRHGRPLGPDVARKGGVDAVVVGSGAGGGPVAVALARAGYRVVVLEKGPAYDQRDFVNDEIKQCRRDFFVPYVSDEPHVRVDHHGKPRQTNEGWTACCVGGATVHFAGYTFRLHPEDLRLATLLGPVEGSSLADWPIGWEDLLPYYERVEVLLGVSGDAAKNPFEPHRRPLPLPPLPVNGIAKLVEQGCEKLGYHPYPTARAILSRAWDGRAPCQQSHFCANYGCEVGAKSSSLAALLPKALATGNCQIRPLSMAHTVELDRQGRAVAVGYIDAKGNRQRLAASVVVVACSPLESARLLLHSRIPDESGQLGRNLMFMSLGTGSAAFARSDARIKGLDWERPFVNRSFQDLYLIKEGKTRRKGGTVSFLFPHANPIFTAERLATGGPRPEWGARLQRSLRHHYQEVRELEFEVFSEPLPTEGSRVTLDPRIKDQWGLPAARFEHQHHPANHELNKEIVGKALEVLRATGGRDVKATRVGGHSFWLQGGTCRFGDDPKSSVLDRDCRLHAVPNLFVTDGSFMPTMGGVSNTLTVEANALRVGDRIVALGREHGLFRKTRGKG